MAFWLQKGTFIVGLLAAHSLKIWKKSDDIYYFLAFTENFKNSPKTTVFRVLRRNGEKSGKTEGTMSSDFLWYIWWKKNLGKKNNFFVQIKKINK